MSNYRDFIKGKEKTEILVRTQSDTLRFFCTLDNIISNRIQVSKPINMNASFNFSQGQELEVYIYTKNGILKLNTKLISNDIASCTIEAPDEAKRIQRREFIRVDMQVKVLLKLDNTKIIEAQTKNISAKGIKINLKEDISKYTRISAKLLFSQGSIETILHPIKIKKISINGKLAYGTSFAFIALTDKETDFIVKKCFEYQAKEQRRKLDLNIE